MAYPIFFTLYFFERLLFAGQKSMSVLVFLAPVKLILALVPPSIYVGLPLVISWRFFNMIAETNSYIIALGSAAVIFGFLFFLTCFRVKEISGRHPGGYTLKPREVYQETVKHSLIWFLGFLATLIQISTIVGLIRLIGTGMPPLQNHPGQYLSFSL